MNNEKNNTSNANATSAQWLTSMLSNYLDYINYLDPFYVFLAFRSLHVPYIASPEWRALCLSQDEDTTVCNRPKPSSSKDLDFYGTLASFDQAVGDVLRLVKEKRPFDDTMFLFTSDNGPEDEAHDGAGSVGPLVGGKRDLWEGVCVSACVCVCLELTVSGGIRVPGWIHWPGKISSNVVSEKLTTLMDFPITIMNAALVEGAGLIAKNSDGVNLLELINDPQGWVRPKGFGVCEYSSEMDASQGVVCKEIAYLTTQDGVENYKFKAARGDIYNYNSPSGLVQGQLFNINAERNPIGGNLKNVINKDAVDWVQVGKQNTCGGLFVCCLLSNFVFLVLVCGF